MLSCSRHESKRARLRLAGVLAPLALVVRASLIELDRLQLSRDQRRDRLCDCLALLVEVSLDTGLVENGERASADTPGDQRARPFRREKLRGGLATAFTVTFV